MLVFRSHDEVPDAITCTTILGLAQEWVSINQASEHHHQVVRLGFAGCVRAGDVVDLIDRSPRDQQNQMLHALIIDGAYLAARIVLQALLPKLLGIARSRASYSATLDDHLQGIITDLWQAIADYPVHRTNHVAMNLIGMARRAFEPDNDRHFMFEEIEDTLTVPDGDQVDADQQLQAIFHAGLQQGRVTVDDLELLSEVYLEGLTSTQSAARRGVSGPSVRKRCQRIRHRLSAAVT